MSARPTFVAALVTAFVLSAGLAGCFGKGGGGKEDVVDPAGTPTFSAETGAIRGILVNDEELPIAGGQVGLQERPDIPTLSDLSGAFVFSELAPGTYRIEALAIGYDRRVQTVEVQAGDVTDVQVRLVSATLLGVPYSVTLGPMPGKFFCAFGAGVSAAEAGLAGPCKPASFGGALEPAEDGYQGVAQGEENTFSFPNIVSGNASAPEDVFRSLVLEVQWIPTSGAAGQLQAAVEQYQPDGRDLTADDFLVYGSASGASPLRLVLHAGEAYPNGDAEVPEDVDSFQMGVFPTFADAPQVFTEQRFELWLTLFYNQAAADDFTVLADA